MITHFFQQAIINFLLTQIAISLHCVTHTLHSIKTIHSHGLPASTSSCRFLRVPEEFLLPKRILTTCSRQTLNSVRTSPLTLKWLTRYKNCLGIRIWLRSCSDTWERRFCLLIASDYIIVTHCFAYEWIFHIKDYVERVFSYRLCTSMISRTMCGVEKKGQRTVLNFFCTRIKNMMNFLNRYKHQLSTCRLHVLCIEKNL